MFVFTQIVPGAAGSLASRPVSRRAGRLTLFARPQMFFWALSAERHKGLAAAESTCC